MLCPDCRAPLDEAFTCLNGHRFCENDGVLTLVAAGFAEEMQRFASALGAARRAEGRPQLDPTAYEHLPFERPGTRLPGGSLEWRLRRYDLVVINRLLGNLRRQRILDVGAWNGWLSNRLAAAGHMVTAVDYFADEYDGLAARKHHRASWRAIQMDLRDLSVLDESFDVVIANRCLAFAPDPLAFVDQLLERVNPGGLLILTGLQIFRDARAKAQQVRAYLDAHRARHGFDLLLFPTRGYLDRTDHARLQAAGTILRPYRQLWPAHAKALLNPSLPRHYYGVRRRVSG
jgi:SAM-dependent methyltransferase